jgi:hypothetical protein
MTDVVAFLIVGAVVYGVYKIGYRNGWEDGCCRETEVLEEIWEMEYIKELGNE